MKRRRERKTKGKRTVYNATITQIRKFAYSSRHKCAARDWLSRLLASQIHLPIYTPLSSLFLDYDKSNGWNVAAFTIYYPVVVLVPRPFARAKFTESINSVAPRTEAADSRRSRDATTHGRERKNVFIATAPRVIHAFIQRNFNEISTELHRSLGMSSRIVSLVSC